MKRIITCLFIVVIIALFTITMWPKKVNESDMKKVTVAEVAHSIFYAPMYVADSLEYFEDENIDLEIILTAGADKVTAAVLSGDVNIGFCGSEATIYIYNQDVEDYLVTFSGLTKKDGSFLVSRKKYDDFKLTDLKGKSIIGGRKGGMPEMTFEWVLKENGIDPKKDVSIDTSVAFPAMSGAFIGGQGDFVTLFEPNALEVEKAGYGYVVTSVGDLGGIVPYTAFNAKKSYIEDNPKVIKGFTKAIQKGLDFVHNKSANEVAEKILPYFSSTSLDDLTNIVQRYMDIDAWYDTTFIAEDDFNHIQEIMQSAGELKEFAPYEDLVNNKYN